MKELRIEDFPIGRLTMAAAFEAAFGAETLMRTHGEGCQVGPWENRQENHRWVSQRQYSFRIPVAAAVAAAPALLRRFLPIKATLAVTTQQTREPALPGTGARIEVRNQVRFRSPVVAGLATVRPRFVLAQRPDTGMVTLSIYVEHITRLPFPLSAMAENFMLGLSKKNFDQYCRVISQRAPRDAPGKKSSG